MEAVRRVAESGEFAVTGDGELDLGLDPQSASAAGALPADDVWWDGVPGADPAYEELIDRGWDPGDHSDPENDPDDFEAWLAGLPAGVREDFLAGPFTGEGPIPAGFLHHMRTGPSGAGFASGGVLDTAEPDEWLARMLTAATSDGHAGLGESELIGVLCGWRRMSAWAAAGEAAAVITLARACPVFCVSTGDVSSFLVAADCG